MRRMKGKVSGRTWMQTAGGAALATPHGAAAASSEPRFEGPDTPKICLGLGDGGGGETGGRRIKQLGVDHVLSGGPRIPWDEADLRNRMERLKADGLSPGNLMIAGFNNAMDTRPGR